MLSAAPGERVASDSLAGAALRVGRARRDPLVGRVHRLAARNDGAGTLDANPQTAANCSLTCVRRMLLPEGSRNPESMP